MKIHRPPHLYLDDTYYFITSKTIMGKNFFDTGDKKSLLIDVIQKAVRQFQATIYAWAVLNNHYHILIKMLEGKNLSRLMQTINGRSSRRLKRLQTSEGRLISLPSREWRVWHNYWDHGIRDDKDFWKHFNYIHQNAVKHGYVKKMRDYQFSSFNFWLNKKGNDWLNSCFELCPIIDFMTK